MNDYQNIKIKHLPLFNNCVFGLISNESHFLPLVSFVCPNSASIYISRNFIIEQLKQKFKDQEFFSREALSEFYLGFEPDLKESNFRWRIYNLKEKNLIRPISRNEFTLAYRPNYKPNIEDTERRLSLMIDKEFKTSKKAIWSTQIITEFRLHQPGRFFTLIETEKEAIEPVFHF